MNPKGFERWWQWSYTSTLDIVPRTMNHCTIVLWVKNKTRKLVIYGHFGIHLDRRFSNHVLAFCSHRCILHPALKNISLFSWVFCLSLISIYHSIEGAYEIAEKSKKAFRKTAQ
jgi:hypothetical protein